MASLYMRYLGCLGLLSECSVHVPEEVREQIEQAFTDACHEHPLAWRRILDRCEIESVVATNPIGAKR